MFPFRRHHSRRARCFTRHFETASSEPAIELKRRWTLPPNPNVAAARCFSRSPCLLVRPSLLVRHPAGLTWRAQSACRSRRRSSGRYRRASSRSTAESLTRTSASRSSGPTPRVQRSALTRWRPTGPARSLVKFPKAQCVGKRRSWIVLRSRILTMTACSTRSHRIALPPVPYVSSSSTDLRSFRATAPMRTIWSTALS